MQRSLIVLSAVCALGFSSAYSDELSVPLEGIWKATASTDGGDKNYTVTVTSDGGSLGGTIIEDGKEDSRNLDRVSVEGKAVSIGITFEANGQTGEVKVAAKETDPGKLSGEWSIVDSSGTKLMGGDWTATKEVEESLAGTWDSVVELPESGTMNSVLKFTEKDGGYEGTVESETHNSTVKKVTDADGKVTIDVTIEQEGVQMNAQIRSERDGNDLVGSWHLLDGNGGETASGVWKATKRAEFVLVGSWEITAILPEEKELQATFDIHQTDDGLAGTAKMGDDGTELKSVTVGEDGAVTITLDFEMDGTAGVATIAAAPDGINTLTGKWTFTDGGSENFDGKWSASRADAKRGVLRR
ncbi:MAG: hypothetical protein O3C21_00895 [Verrucomicrobia bacterium]|nr:hypothetical protein [Verrucomicrobiota bacterium]